MAADLFETYVVTIVATMLLAAIFFAPPLRDKMLLLPLVIGAVCIVTSVIGTFFVRLGADNGIMRALYKGLIATGILSVAAIALVIYWLFGFSQPLAMTTGASVTGFGLWLCAIVGLVGHRLHRLDHRILHRDRIPPGAQHRAKLDHRPRHQRDPGPRRVDGGDGAAGHRDLRRHHRVLI